MKKISTVLGTLIIAALFLSGCDALYQITKTTPTPTPPIVSENSTWQVKVLKMQKYQEPVELSCSDCNRDGSSAVVNLQKGYSYLDVTTTILNKTALDQKISVLNLGLQLSAGIYSCGGMTVQGNDYCLLSGVIRGEQKYVNKGLESFDSDKSLTFAPDSPDGETVDFIFIIKTRSKLSDFYFDELPPLNIRKMKPVAVQP